MLAGCRHLSVGDRSFRATWVSEAVHVRSWHLQAHIGQDHTLVAHRRSDGGHCTVKIVCLATQQDHVIRAIELALLNRVCLNAEFAAVLSFYDQAIASKLGRARWPHKKSNVGPALDEHSAKVSPERARAQYQVSHLLALRCQLLEYQSIDRPPPAIAQLSASKHAEMLSG